MNQRISARQVTSLLFILLLALLGISSSLLANPTALRMAPLFAGGRGTAGANPFDYEQAAANSAYRWQAMARFYEEQGLLTRDVFDYEQAAANSAHRWQAMARAYERMGLLNDK